MAVMELRRKLSDCNFSASETASEWLSETGRKPVGNAGLKESSKEKRAGAHAYACARA